MGSVSALFTSGYLATRVPRTTCPNVSGAFSTLGSALSTSNDLPNPLLPPKNKRVLCLQAKGAAHNKISRIMKCVHEVNLNS